MRRFSDRFAHWFPCELSLFLILCLFAAPALAASTPQVQSGLPANEFPGSTFCYDLDFSNIGDPGYGPYVRLILPPELSFQSATFIEPGLNVNVTDAGAFPAPPNNVLSDPLSLNIPNEVTGPEYASLILLELPVGSVVESGPPLTTEVCLTLDQSAVIDAPLAVTTQPLYRYGETPTASSNDTIEGTPLDQVLVPSLFLLKKEAGVSEGERVPGPTFGFNYRLNGEIAQSKILDVLQLRDDPEWAFLARNGDPSINQPANCNIQAVANPTDPYVADCTDLIGGAGVDVTFTMPVYVTDVLDPAGCSTQPILNEGFYTAQSGSITLTNFPASPETATITAKHLAAQSSVDTSDALPGDTLIYTVAFQVSEYADATRVEVVETLPDGVALVPNSGVLTTSGGVTNLPIDPAQTSNPDDSTTLRFDLTAAVGSGLAAGTTGTLIYQAEIAQQYADGSPLLATDELAHGTDLEFDLSGGASGCSDGSSTRVSIRSISSDKALVNPQPEYFPGDEIVFKLTFEIPAGSTRNFLITDYFPLPVIDAGALSTDPDLAVNPDISFASDNDVGSNPDSIVHDAATNSLALSWPMLSSTSAQTLSLTITARISLDPYADRLNQTNLAQMSAENSSADPIQQTIGSSFVARASSLTVTKGIANTDGDGVPVPGTPGTPVDSDLEDAQAGDRVDYVITVENVGGHPAANVILSDVPPAGVDAGSCSLSSVVFGDSSAPAPVTSGDLFGGGLRIEHQIVDIEGTLASLAANNGSGGPPYGRDTLIVAYSCTLADGVYPQQTIENEASTTWTSVGGSDTYAPRTDTATVGILAPSIGKNIDSVVPDGAGNGSATVTVGDTMSYDLVVTLPGGTTRGLTLVDTLPAGFEYLANSATVIPGSFNGAPPVIASELVVGQDLSLTFDDIQLNRDADEANRRFVVRVNALVLDDSDNSGLVTPQHKRNSVTLDYTDNPTPGAFSDHVDTDFVEPDLQITKTSSPRNVEGGDTVEITLRLTNHGTSQAHDVEVSDVLNDSGNVFDLGTVAPISSDARFTYGYVSPTVTYTMNPGQVLAAGETATFKFSAEVLAGVTTGSNFENTADASGFNQAAGSSSIKRETADQDETNIRIKKAGISKSIIDHSEIFTPPEDAAIGEILTYRITVSIPAGLTKAPTGSNLNNVIDILPVGLQFLTGSDVYFYAAEDGVIDSGNFGPISDSPSVITPSLSDNDRRLQFDLGALTNTDSKTQRLYFEFQALVLNVAENNRGDEKKNTSRFRYANADDRNQSRNATHSVYIAEPGLATDKSASPQSVTAGSTVSYEVTLTNRAGAHVTTAWEPMLSDVFADDKLQDITIVGAELKPSNQPLAPSCIQEQSVAGGYLIEVGLGCLPADQRKLAPGEQIVLSYTARISANVLFEETLVNHGIGIATSLPGDKGSGDVTPGNPGDDNGERTGLVNEHGSQNDLLAYTNAQVEANRPVISKTPDALLQIGEMQTTQLIVAVPPGTTSDFQVIDPLPPGLRYTGAAIDITVPVGITATQAPDTAPGAGTSPLIFDFGDISNSDVQGLEIIIEYQVQVENNIANQRGVLLDNVARLSYDGSLQPSSDQARIQVIEPDLEINKKITSGATGGSAGSGVSYEVILENGDPQATAYLIDLRDVLPAELLRPGSGDFFKNIQLVNDGQLAVLSSNGSTPLDESHAQFDNTVNAGDTLTWPLFDLPPRGSITIRYEAFVIDGAGVGAVLSNDVEATYNSLAGGGGRDGSDGGDDSDDSLLNNYRVSDTASVHLDAEIEVQKQVSGSGASKEYTIGDRVLFELRVDVLEGLTYDLDVSDVLPDGLDFDEATGLLAIDAGPNISYDGSGSATYDPGMHSFSVSLGNLLNTADGDSQNDYIVLYIETTVADTAANVDGAVLVDELNVVAEDAGGNPLNAGPALEDIRIVEPNLIITKTASILMPPVGDVFTYTVEVKHDNSHADARDVILDEVLPTGLSYVPGSTSGQAIAIDESITHPRFDLGDITLLEGGKTFSFDVELGTDADTAQPLTNVIDGSYHSQPTGNTIRRGYAASGSETVFPAVANYLYATKTVANVIDVDGNGENNPGDTMEYRVLLINRDQPVSNVVFTDDIPNRTTLVSGSVSTSQGSDVGSATQVKISVGSMNVGDAVEIRFRVAIGSNISDGATVLNQGEVDSTETAPLPTDWDGIEANGYQPTPFVVSVPEPPRPPIDPGVYLQKTVDHLIDVEADGVIRPGDTMRYRFSIENTGNEDLTNLSIGDRIPAGLSYVPASLDLPIDATGSVQGSDIQVEQTVLTVGERLSFSLDVTVDGPPLYDTNSDPLVETFVNQAEFVTDQLQGASDSDGDPDNGMQATEFTAYDKDGPVIPPPQQGDLYVEKTVALHADNNGNGVANPGDVMRYRLIFHNTGLLPLSRVKLLDQIPGGLSYLPGSMILDPGVSGDVVNDELWIRIELLSVGDSAQASFDVVIDGPPLFDSDADPKQETFVNQSQVYLDETPFGVTDSNGTPSDGYQKTRFTAYEQVAEIPTLGEWALLLLISVLVAIGIISVRRRCV